MNSMAFKVIGIGSLFYVLFVFLVMKFYPDKPENMDWKDREVYNKVHITKLKLGATLDEVLALLGSPDITEAKKTKSHQFQVMFYRTQHVRADGLTTQDECTPLLFRDSMLIAWGEGAYLSYQQS